LTKSYRFAALLATVALALGATTAFAHDGGGDNHGHGDKGQGHRHGGDVLRSDLFGSQVAPTGPVLFGVDPGGLPWVIARGEARVRRNGRVKVRVEGLVIPTPPRSSWWRCVRSCQSATSPRSCGHRHWPAPTTSPTHHC